MRRPPPWLVHPLALFVGSRLVILPAFGVGMLLAPLWDWNDPQFLR